LVRKVGDCIRMRVREEFEEGDIEAAVAGFGVSHERWELIMVPNEDKGVGKADRAYAHRKRDLRGFIDDAIIKAAFGEYRVIDSKAGGCDNGRFVEGFRDFWERLSRRSGE
jgi:hypothetical protein